MVPAILSNIVAALYYCRAAPSERRDMSFDVSTPSAALSQAVSYANQSGVVLVAAAGNQNNQRPCVPRRAQPKRNGHCFDIGLGCPLFLLQLRQHGRLDCGRGRIRHQHIPGRHLRQRFRDFLQLSIGRRHSGAALNAKPSLTHAKAASALSHAIRLTPDLHNGRLDVYQASPPGSTVALAQAPVRAFVLLVTAVLNDCAPVLAASSNLQWTPDSLRLKRAEEQITALRSSVICAF